MRPLDRKGNGTLITEGNLSKMKANSAFDQNLFSSVCPDWVNSRSMSMPR